MSKKAIEDAVKIMNETGLMEITTEASLLWGIIKERIHLSKQNVSVVGSAPSNAAIGASVSQEMPEKAPKSTEGAITSPMVGVVYLSPEPNSKQFAIVGQKVSKGEILCLIEAMKTFNPIKAPRDGVVAEILVKDGDTIEFGAPLIVLK